MNFWDISEAVIDGILSIPADVFYGGRRTLEDVGVFGGEVQRENAVEREQVLGLLKNVWQNNAIISRVIKIIIGDFVEKIPEETIGRIEDRLKLSGIQFATRKATQFTLSNFIGTLIAKKVLTRVIAKRLAKFGVGIAISAILIQGVLERSSDASRRLRSLNPNLYQKLAKENLNVIYFLIEEELAPFVTLSARDIEDQRHFDKFIIDLEVQLK